VATTGEGVEELIETLADHDDYLDESGERRQKARTRAAEEIRTLLRNDTADLLERELDRHGGIESLAASVVDRETDPYSVADRVVDPLRDCLDERDA
jgi:LAO/AO transport system kinase